MNSDSPVVVMGMHRSGTSIVAAVLSELGVHMGHLQDSNHEPLSYVALNDWILRQAGTSWEYPTEVNRLLDQPAAFKHAAQSIRRASAGRLMRSNHLTRSVDRTKSRWGWKDPRNTATLPVWLDVFPTAQVVYVHRHGVPVAASLTTRRSKFEASDLRIWHKVLTPIKPGPGMGSRLWTFEGSLEMWSDYCTLGESHVQRLGDRALSFSYEGLLVDPEGAVQQLADFVGTNPSDEQLRQAASQVRAGDPFKFRRDTELVQREVDSEPILARHGYGLQEL